VQVYHCVVIHLWYNRPLENVIITTRKIPWWWHVRRAEKCCSIDNLVRVKLVVLYKLIIVVCQCFVLCGQRPCDLLITADFPRNAYKKTFVNKPDEIPLRKKPLLLKITYYLFGDEPRFVLKRVRKVWPSNKTYINTLLQVVCYMFWPYHSVINRQWCYKENGTAVML
jgi:hypothetical protein